MSMQQKQHDVQISPRDEPSIIEGGVDFRRWLLAIASRPYLILMIVIFSLLGAYVFLQQARPVYTTKTELKYESNTLQFLDIAGSADVTRLPDEIQTQIAIIRSHRIVQNVVESLGLQPETVPSEAMVAGDGGILEKLFSLKNSLSKSLVNYEITPIDPEVSARQRLQESILSNLIVIQKGKTRVIEIRYSDEDKHRAARISDEFAHQYIQYLRQEKRMAYDEATNFLNDQLNEAKNALQKSEAQLQNYKGTNDVRVLEQNRAIAEKVMQATSEEIQRTLNELARLEARRTAAADERLQRTVLADDPRHESLIKELRDRELDRVPLIMENTESHPSVVKIDREILVLQQQISRAAKELIEDISAKVEIATINLTSLRDRLSSQESQMEQIQQEMIQYRLLEREVDSTRSLYASLLDSSKRVSMGGDASTALATILEPAKIPEYPTSPRIMRTLILFIVLGFFIGIAISLLIDFLDQSVKDEAQLEAVTGVSCLASVPYLRPSDGRKPNKQKSITPIVSKLDPKSQEAEAFRMLRTSIQYSRGGQPPKVLLITSALPDEGKSTLALNLAISHVQRGDKVLLIDADLKRPSVHRYFKLDRQPGLSDVITGQSNWKDSLQKTSMAEGLDILSAGHSSPAPTDLLESSAMMELIGELRDVYTTVIIDAAPLQGMADSLVLGSCVDGICLVVNRGRTPMAVIQKMVQSISRIKAPLLGCILNHRQKMNLPEKWYGKSYYSYTSSRYGLRPEK